VSDIGQPYATSSYSSAGNHLSSLCEQVRILHSTAPAVVALGRAWRPWIKVRFPIGRGVESRGLGAIGRRLVERRDARASRVGMHGGCALRIANCELRGAVGRLPSCTCRQGCRGSEARWHEEMRLRGSLRERQGTSGSRCRRSEPEGEVATRKRRTTLAAGHVDGCICNQPANTSEGSCACAMLGLALDLPFRLAKGSKGCARRLSARDVEDE
jgi:hypothetical protein